MPASSRAGRCGTPVRTVSPRTGAGGVGVGGGRLRRGRPGCVARGCRANESSGRDRRAATRGAATDPIVRRRSGSDTRRSPADRRPPRSEPTSRTPPPNRTPADLPTPRAHASPESPDTIASRLSWASASRDSSRKLIREVATREPYGSTTATREESADADPGGGRGDLVVDIEVDDAIGHGLDLHRLAGRVGARRRAHPRWSEARSPGTPDRAA